MNNQLLNLNNQIITNYELANNQTKRISLAIWLLDIGICLVVGIWLLLF